MTEVAAAIIGSLIGGLLSWLITRKQPSYVICEKIFAGWFGLRLPNVQISYRNISLQKLYVLRLRIRNTGSQFVEKPELLIKLDKKPQVLDTAIDYRTENVFETVIRATSGMLLRTNDL